MSLVLGPLLRRVVGTTATVWVQTARPATVEVHAGPARGAARTFLAFERHYALVIVDGLPPGEATPYQIVIDGKTAWPPTGYAFPHPVIRTRTEGDPVLLVFGSCRQAVPNTTEGLPPDALDAYAAKLARGGTQWPDCVALLGDQVYADELSPVTRSWLRRRRRRRHAPPDQVVDFDEYAALYQESWTDPEIRWLLSTVPSVMIFDDHEIIDDWNTSQRWRAATSRLPWWPRRISAGLASYWLYQHLGNLDPDGLAADPVWAAVRDCADATGLLRDFGALADTDRSGYRWSYVIDIGGTRLVVLDNRCARVLEPGRRAILPPEHWDWLARLVLAGGYEHLVLGASLPWLLPPAIHDLEASVERLAESPRRPVADAAEWLRQALDLEHWAAFGHSFDLLTDLLTQLSTAGELASISVLSGDVHHSYAARPRLGELAVVPVHQLTCSPVHNRVPAAMRPVFRLAWHPVGAWLGRRLARLAGLPRDRIRWTRLAGPYFGNAVSTLVHSGRSARLAIDGTGKDGVLVRIAEVPLTGSR
jgi:hypothetical protein